MPWTAKRQHLVRELKTAPGHRCPGAVPVLPDCSTARPRLYAVTTAASLLATISGAMSSCTPAPSSPSGPNSTSLYR